MNKTNTTTNAAGATQPAITKYNTGWLQAMIAPGMSQPKLTRALKAQGWIKMQAGLWMRPCVRVSAQDIHIEALKPFLPCAANVRIMFVTDSQWGKAVCLCGPNYPRS